MSETDKTLRLQIEDAIERIGQQLDRLRAGPTIGGPSDDRSVIADLEAERLALEEARARLA
jgi:hypothetical protein